MPVTCLNPRICRLGVRYTTTSCCGNGTARCWCSIATPVFCFRSSSGSSPKVPLPGEKLRLATAQAPWSIEIVKRPPGTIGFEVLLKCRIVERRIASGASREHHDFRNRL